MRAECCGDFLHDGLPRTWARYSSMSLSFARSPTFAAFQGLRHDRCVGPQLKLINAFGQRLLVGARRHAIFVLAQHAQPHTARGQHVFDFFQAGVTKVFVIQHFLLGDRDQITQGEMSIFAKQFRERTDKFKIIDRGREDFATALRFTLSSFSS